MIGKSLPKSTSCGVLVSKSCLIVRRSDFVDVDLFVGSFWALRFFRFVAGEIFQRRPTSFVWSFWILEAKEIPKRKAQGPAAGYFKNTRGLDTEFHLFKRHLLPNEG